MLTAHFTALQCQKQAAIETEPLATFIVPVWSAHDPVCIGRHIAISRLRGQSRALASGCHNARIVHTDYEHPKQQLQMGQHGPQHRSISLITMSPLCYPLHYHNYATAMPRAAWQLKHKSELAYLHSPSSLAYVARLLLKTVRATSQFAISTTCLHL